MDLPCHNAQPDAIHLDPIPLHDLAEKRFRDSSNDIVANYTFDPLDILEVFQSSFNFTEWQIFRAAMIKEAGLIVGSSAMAAIGVVKPSAPAQLDILVGCNRGKALHTALRNFG